MTENANVEKKSAQITIEQLIAKPFGILETREFRYQDDVSTYFLAKQKDGSYTIGFSETGTYCAERVDENIMVNLINDEEYSYRWVFDIYMHSPHLNPELWE